MRRLFHQLLGGHRREQLDLLFYSNEKNTGWIKITCFSTISLVFWFVRSDLTRADLKTNGARAVQRSHGPRRSNYIYICLFYLFLVFCEKEIKVAARRTTASDVLSTPLTVDEKPWERSIDERDEVVEDLAQPTAISGGENKPTHTHTQKRHVHVRENTEIPPPPLKPKMNGTRTTKSGHTKRVRRFPIERGPPQFLVCVFLLC